MSSSAVTAELDALAARTAAALPSGHNGAGDPWRRQTKIVNGHKVVANMFGWGDDRPVIFELDDSTAPLTLTEAVAAID